MVAERPGLCVPGGQVAEHQDGLAVQRDSGLLEHWLTLTPSFIAPCRVARIPAIPALPPWKSRLRLFAFDQVNDEPARRVPLQREGFRPAPEPLHIVAVKGADILHDRLQSLTVARLGIAVGRG